MVVWIWYAVPHHSPPQITSLDAHASPNPFELSPHRNSPINQLQVQPSPWFNSFVTYLLKITSVSHSVILVSLLFMYRLKRDNLIIAESGSEQRPFVASLILANKYLDE